MQMSIKFRKKLTGYAHYKKKKMLRGPAACAVRPDLYSSLMPGIWKPGKYSDTKSTSSTWKVLPLR